MLILILFYPFKNLPIWDNPGLEGQFTPEK